MEFMSMFSWAGNREESGTLNIISSVVRLFVVSAIVTVRVASVGN